MTRFLVYVILENGLEARRYLLPSAQDGLVACRPVGVIGVQGEASLNLKVQAGAVVEVDADAVIAGVGGKLDFFNDLALSLAEAKESAGRGCEWVFRLNAAAHRLRQRNRAFSFVLSHVASFVGDLVRARSVFAHRALPAVVVLLLLRFRCLFSFSFFCFAERRRPRPRLSLGLG